MFAVGGKPAKARYHPVEFGVSGAIGQLRLTKSDLASPAERFTTLVWMYGADRRRNGWN